MSVLDDQCETPGKMSFRFPTATFGASARDSRQHTSVCRSRLILFHHYSFMDFVLSWLRGPWWDRLQSCHLLPKGCGTSPWLKMAELVGTREAWFGTSTKITKTRGTALNMSKAVSQCNGLVYGWAMHWPSTGNLHVVAVPLSLACWTLQGVSELEWSLASLWVSWCRGTLTFGLQSSWHSHPFLLFKAEGEKGRVEESWKKPGRCKMGKTGTTWDKDIDRDRCSYWFAFLIKIWFDVPFFGLAHPWRSCDDNKQGWFGGESQWAFVTWTTFGWTQSGCVWK